MFEGVKDGVKTALRQWTLNLAGPDFERRVMALPQQQNEYGVDPFGFDPNFMTYPPLAPAGHCSFYVEYSHHGELSKRHCETYAVQDLLNSRMIHREDDILFARANEIPHAYVLYDEEYGPAKAEIVRFLDAIGIQTAGRYGQWEYSSMEDAILAGRACAQKLDADSA